MKPILPIAALCCLIASTAKADCSQLSKPRPFTAIDVTKTVAAMKAPLAAVRPMAAGGNNSIVGLWLTTFTSGGQIIDQGFDMWTSDGTEILNDAPPPSTGGGRRFARCSH